MRKITIIIFIILILSGISISCEDFFLDSDPIGHVNPEDPEFTGTVAGSAEIKVSSGGTVINTGDTYSLPSDTEAYDTQSFNFTIENLSSDTALTLSGSPLVVVSGADSSLFSISQQPTASISAGGSSIFTLDFAPASAGTKTAIITIVNNDSNESSFVINISAAATFTPLGTALADDFASSAITLISDSYLAPRSASDATITVGGDITVQSGATLTIYEGVTLDMGTHRLIVDGCLCVEGTDGERVKFTGNDWAGVLIESGGTANINGAVFEDFNDSSSYAINIAGDDFTMTNSRIHQPGTSVGVRMTAPDAGSVHTFENNIFVFLASSGASGNQPAIDMTNAPSSPGLTVSIRYNTFIGKGSSGYTIDFPDDNPSTYLIEKNLIANGTAIPKYMSVVLLGNSAPVVSVKNNVYDSDIPLSSGSSADTETDNLPFSWSNGEIFENFDANDLRMKQTTTYPSLAQADDIAALEGCLTNGHANEVGAYGNGGYPPLWNE